MAIHLSLSTANADIQSLAARMNQSRPDLPNTCMTPGRPTFMDAPEIRPVKSLLLISSALRDRFDARIGATSSSVYFLSPFHVFVHATRLVSITRTSEIGFPFPLSLWNCLSSSVFHIPMYPQCPIDTATRCSV